MIASALALWIVVAPQGRDLSPEPGAATAEQVIALELFEQRFLQAVRGARAPGVDLDAALTTFDRVAEFVPELAPSRRPFATLGIAVRRAEIHVLQRQSSVATATLTAARDAAIAAGVWQEASASRELACVLLWQVAPLEFERWRPFEAEFLAVREQAVAALLKGAPIAEAPPAQRARLALLRLVRLGAQLAEPTTERAAEQELAQLGRALPAGDLWRHKAFLFLVWHFYLRGDVERAALYLDEVPIAESRDLRARFAFERGDLVTALREAAALAKADVRYEQLYGDVLEAKGEYERARSAYQRALAASPGGPLAEVVLRRGLGDCALGEWRRSADPSALTRARQEYESALRAAEPLRRAGSGVDETVRQRGVEWFQLQVRLAEVAEAEGRSGVARREYWAALETLEALRGAVAADAFGGTLLAFDVLDAVEGVLRTAVGSAAAAFDALAALERGKARTLLDWMHAPPRFDNVDASRVLAAAAHRLATSVSVAEQRRHLDSFERERIALGSQQRRRATSLDARALRRLSVDRPDVVFLSYWLGRRSCWVVAVQGGEGLVLRLADRASAETALGAAFTACADPDGGGGGGGGGAASQQSALRAAALLFVPEEVAERVRRCGRVVFSPDEELGGLPFEALPIRTPAGSSEETALGLLLPVERAPSWSVRAALRSRSAQGDRALVLHTVRMPEGVERGFGLEPLAFSAREAESLRASMPAGDTTEIAGVDATRAAFAAALRRDAFGIVHVSAHAVSDPVLPTSSLLLLADGATPVVSLIELPLRGALLVLSACSSARGEARVGDGEVGLLGWPLAAGARGAVASHWRVNQQATADLMGTFHAFLTRGDDEATAMWRARRVLAAAPQYSDPHYWAGFGVYAAPAAPARWPALRWAVGVIAALGVGWVAIRVRRSRATGRSTR